MLTTGFSVAIGNWSDRTVASWMQALLNLQHPQMTFSRIGAIVITLAAGGATLQAQGSCRSLPAFRGERRDTTTIVRLERAWNDAFLLGDTAAERCLLTPDFTEILRDGQVKALADELGFATQNIGRHLTPPVSPALSVLLHGDVAVAYGTVDGRSGATQYADFYVWDAGRWRAFFAQQTPLEHS
ncbi:MAG: nuclear transport factor 2 family protein [Gemmatimonadales bacterium]